MFRRWFVTRSDFDQAIEYHNKALERLNHLYWQRQRAHDRLLEKLGLSEVDVPATVVLRTKYGTEQGEE